MTHPIPGKGITPEAAEALGLDPSDPRIVIDSDAVELNEDFSDGISEPFTFPTLNLVGGDQAEDVPPVMSSGDSIPDAGIGESEGVSPGPRSGGTPGSRIKRANRDSGSQEQNPRDATSKPPSMDEWTNFFGKIVLRCACDWYLSFAFQGIDEDMLTDREIERLALTDDERKLIATPLAELSNKSKFMRKHGRTIVSSGDAFHALIVFGAWFSRVNRIAAKYKPRQPKVRLKTQTGGTNGSSGPSPAPSVVTYSEGATGGRIPDGFPIYGGGTG